MKIEKFFLWETLRSSLAKLPLPAALASSPARERVFKVKLFDRQDPESLFNKLPPNYRKYLSAIEEDKDAIRTLRWGERMIRREYKPTAEQARCRLSFWDEYARSLDTGRDMRAEYIPGGSFDWDGFHEYIANPINMAYLCNVPPHYARATEEILLVGLERLRDIFDLPLQDAKGRVNGGVLSAVIKAVDMLDKRVKGAILQKVAVHQMHTHQQISDMGDARVVTDASPEQLAYEELKSLEKQITDVRKRMDEQYAVVPSKKGQTKVIEVGDGSSSETEE